MKLVTKKFFKLLSSLNNVQQIVIPPLGPHYYQELQLATLELAQKERDKQYGGVQSKGDIC